MARHLKDAEPKYALVVWPDIAAYAEMPCCIPITELAAAITHGAVTIAIEDADFCKPRPRIQPDLITLRLRFNHPYRYDAEWKPRPIMRPADPPLESGADGD